MNFNNVVLLLLVFNGKASGFTATSSSLIWNKKSSISLKTYNNKKRSISLYAVPPEANGKTVTPHKKLRLNVNEKARTVTSVCTSGTLCTVSIQEGIVGAPFGSYVDYVLDDEGNPVVLMNEMSMHTMNIRENNNNDNGNNNNMVTLFTQLAAGNTGQDVSRCSLTGKIDKIDPSQAEDIDAIRMRYSIVHAYADQVMDSPKFDFYRLIPSKIYFVGGFGVLAKWVDLQDYRYSTPDILAKDAASICSKLNGKDHTEDLQLTAQHLLDVTSDIERVRVTNVDRLGMDIRVTSQGARRNKLRTDEFRVGFRIPVISVEDAKSEVLKVFQEAWEKSNGYVWDNSAADGEAVDVELPGAGIPIAKIAEDSLE